MVNTNSKLIDKLKNHSNIGLKVKIYKPKSQFVSFKRDKLNIQILNFHSNILDKYKILGNFFLEQNFRFLEFVLKDKKDEILYIRNEKIKFISREKIKKVVETIYKDKQKLVEDFRLKELIDQRAELIYNEQKLNDTKEIRNTLVKELDKFSKDITASELDDRIVLYTKLNTYLNTISINHKNIEYKFDKSVYLNYNSKDIKEIINQFNIIENIEYKQVDEYIKKIESVISPLGVRVKKEQKIADKRIVNNILNIKNNNTINEVASIFTKSFENNIVNTTQNMWEILNKNITNIKTSDLIETIHKINKTLEVQLSSVFKNVSFSKEYKKLFVNEIKTIFLNGEYSVETKVDEVNKVINSYIDNIVYENQNKQSFTIENKNILEEKIYKQTIQKLSNIGISFHFILKNELRSIVKNTISKTTSIDSIQKYNFVVNEVVEQFLIKQKSNVINNTSILKKYTNNIKQLSPMDIDSSDFVKLGSNVSILNSSEQKIEQIYENIVKEVKSVSLLKHINEQERFEITQEIKQLMKTTDQKTLIKQYKNISKQFINKIDTKQKSDKALKVFIKENITKQEIVKDKLYKTIQKSLDENLSISQIEKIDKKVLLEKLENISKLKDVNEISKSYERVLKEYINKKPRDINIESIIEKNIIKEQVDVDTLYKNIVGQVNTTNKFMNITNKTKLLKKLTKLTKLSNITQINKEYENIINEYKVDTLSSRSIDTISFTKLGENVTTSNVLEEKLEVLYENIIKEIKAKEPMKQISSKEKSKILQKLNRVVKYDNIQELNKEYKSIIKHFTNSTQTINSLEQVFSIDNIYKNIVKEINSSSTNRYINIIDKNEIVKKLTKLSTNTQINKEYKNIVNEYSVDKMSMTRLGDNIYFSNNYEKKMQTVYKNIVEQFVNKTNTKENIRESIINKLISSGDSKQIQNDHMENTLIKNTHRTNLANEHDKDNSLVYVSASEHKKKKQEKIEVQVQEVDNKINEKEYQFSMNVENIYKNLDENLDELALKIFRDIKDELSMQYKRI